jgi:pentatricopeptide repeat protein
LFSRLPDEGFRADLYTHTALINGFFKKELLTEADNKLLRKMEEDGCYQLKKEKKRIDMRFKLNNRYWIRTVSLSQLNCTVLYFP